MRKRISQCLVSVYDKDCKKDLEKYLEENEDLERWGYIENNTVQFLPPIHLYLDFGKRKFLPQTIEKILKEYNLKRSFIDLVLHSKWDIRSVFDYAGHNSNSIISNVAVK